MLEGRRYGRILHEHTERAIQRCGSIDGKFFTWHVQNCLRTKVVTPGGFRIFSFKSHEIIVNNIIGASLHMIFAPNLKFCSVFKLIHVILCQCSMAYQNVQTAVLNIKHICKELLILKSLLSLSYSSTNSDPMASLSCIDITFTGKKPWKCSMIPRMLQSQKSWAIFLRPVHKLLARQDQSMLKEGQIYKKPHGGAENRC